MVTPARSQTVEPAPTRFWVLQIARAVIFAVAGLYITFSRDHSAELGLLVFGITVCVLGVATALLVLVSGSDAVTKRLFVTQSVVSVVAGVVALVLQTGLGTLLLTVSIWAGISGLLELYAGFRLKGRSPLAKDLLIAGGLTALLAVVFVLLPPDFVQTSGGKQDVPLTLTSSVMAVGVFGAYAAIMAVFLAIGGLSLKWQNAETMTKEEAA
ncbi:DUF308 domain-containing protein [Paramicrobacterium sp. CJ85]|uniref:DUF308 domain-containing protein n=1 Tax=Paramicrobacterium sp. CJ85 TaxID=3445355 RepID=UPI003F62B861